MKTDDSNPRPTAQNAEPELPCGGCGKPKPPSTVCDTPACAERWRKGILLDVPAPRQCGCSSCRKLRGEPVKLGTCRTCGSPGEVGTLCPNHRAAWHQVAEVAHRHGGEVPPGTVVPMDCPCPGCSRLRGDPLTVPVGFEPRPGMECRLCTARVQLDDGVCASCRRLCTALHNLWADGILEAKRRKGPPAWLGWITLIGAGLAFAGFVWLWWLLVWAAEGL